MFESMTTMTWSTRALRTIPLQRRAMSLKTAPNLPSDVKIEEETLPHYRAKRFYPARIGETFVGKYHVVGKLGFGGHSTAWLAKDISRWRWQSNRYVALKILTNGQASNTAAVNEINISRRVTTSDTSHRGFKYVRLLLDTFEIKGPDGVHSCLVHEPLREPLWLLQKRLHNKDFTSDGVKALAKIFLQGIDYLHTKCHVIHTDLKSDNIMANFESKSVIGDYVRAETEEPSPQKQDGDRTIYLSRNNFGHPKSAPKAPKITDFGLSVIGDTSDYFHHPIQPDCFRAPEVTLGAGWTYSADIWNLGVLIWEILERNMLFCADVKQYSVDSHLAEVIALLGPPPKALLDRGTETAEFFDEKGVFRRLDLIPDDFSFETSESCLKGEDKRLFLNFMRKMLRWLPEERGSANDLYNDPWLHMPPNV